MSEDAIAALKASLGAERARDDLATRSLYRSDDTPEEHLPAVVLFPHSHEEVQAIVRIAGRHRLPLTPRGAGSGNVGGSLPLQGGAVL
ncbi:MAG: FAD-binding oxidoreductase, partial [Acidithiobacillus sp.]|nr:FAD-binding oxidoreductase [Acidithiobacillus sp.]